MMSYKELSVMLGYDLEKNLGITENVFLSLPIEYQKALIKGCFDRQVKANKLDNLRKRIALKQYNFEEDLKEKVFSLIKKK